MSRSRNSKKRKASSLEGEDVDVREDPNEQNAVEPIEYVVEKIIEHFGAPSKPNLMRFRVKSLYGFQKILL